MKLVSFRSDQTAEAIGLFHDGQVVALHEADGELPSTMGTFLRGFEEFLPRAQTVNEALAEGKITHAQPVEEVTLLSPVPRPTSCRDAYAFRQHVATARRNRGVPMIPEFDQFPVFYFTNHQAIIGGGDLNVEQDHLLRLDFELEVAVVIGKAGKNIDAADADEHIAGFTIMNDFSARQLQMEEMKLNLGPAKGKDFATALGPWLVTPDELAEARIPGHRGAAWDLAMTAFHNGEQISAGNVKEMTWTFGEILERVSYGVDLYPGDVIGSGTVGTGCYLELNGSRRLAAEEKGESYEPVWLKNGDTIELRIDRLGSLSHKIVQQGEYSLLAKKKNV